MGGCLSSQGFREELNPEPKEKIPMDGRDPVRPVDKEIILKREGGSGGWI